MSKRWISMSRGKAKEGSSLKKLAAGSLTFVKAYSNGQANSAIDGLEEELEAEIERDKQSIPTSGFSRWRYKGSKVLKSKHVLLMIVLLNIVDCALVLGELVLDLHHVKNTITQSEETIHTFQQELQTKYPEIFQFHGEEKPEKIFETILKADIIWTRLNRTSNDINNIPYNTYNKNSNVSKLNGIQSYGDRNRTIRSVEISTDKDDREADMTVLQDDVRHRSRRSVKSDGDVQSLHGNHGIIEKEIAESFHGLSLFIVVVLLIETITKVVCFGKHFFTQKLQVFDACIVLASFTVDFVFINGMAVYTIQEFVFILAFMLPWGVIRVVNSLVVAVRDHEHFRLKMLYTQKKKVEQENKNLSKDKEIYKEQLDSMRRLCLAEGVEDWKIQQSIARQHIKPGKGIMGSFASLALGALGAHKGNGSSIWNLLATPKLRRGKSEEWEVKTGVNMKDDTRSLRYTDRVWTVAGTTDLHKKNKKARSLSHQSTIDSDPGTPTIIKNRLKALKRFLKRQDPVDNASFSSMDTVEKDSKCSLNNITLSESSSPPISFDYDSNEEVDHHVSCSPACEIINECSREVSYTDSHSFCDRRESVKSCSEPREDEQGYVRRNSSKKSFRESRRASSRKRKEGLNMRRCESNPEEDSGTTVERIIYAIPDESRDEVSICKQSANDLCEVQLQGKNNTVKQQSLDKTSVRIDATEPIKEETKNAKTSDVKHQFVNKTSIKTEAAEPIKKPTKNDQKSDVEHHSMDTICLRTVPAGPMTNVTEIDQKSDVLSELITCHSKEDAKCLNKTSNNDVTYPKPETEQNVHKTIRNIEIKNDIDTFNENPDTEVKDKNKGVFSYSPKVKPNIVITNSVLPTNDVPNGNCQKVDFNVNFRCSKSLDVENKNDTAINRKKCISNTIRNLSLKLKSPSMQHTLENGHCSLKTNETKTSCTKCYNLQYRRRSENSVFTCTHLNSNPDSVKSTNDIFKSPADKKQSVSKPLFRIGSDDSDGNACEDDDVSLPLLNKAVKA